MSDNKHEQGKLRIELVPPEAVEAIARAMTFGNEVEGYAPYSWESGIPYTKLYAAAVRHLLKFIKGEDRDEKSGLHPIDHALADLAMLKALIERNSSTTLPVLALDDRRFRYRTAEPVADQRIGPADRRSCYSARKALDAGYRRSLVYGRRKDDRPYVALPECE